MLSISLVDPCDNNFIHFFLISNSHKYHVQRVSRWCSGEVETVEERFSLHLTLLDDSAFFRAHQKNGWKNS